MRRPTKQRVVAAVKKDMEHGRKRLIDAVELTSGVMVVEYEVRSKIEEIGTHVQFRVLVEMPNGATTGTIRQSYIANTSVKAHVE